jgi:hypothetical protein
MFLLIVAGWESLLSLSLCLLGSADAARVSQLRGTFAGCDEDVDGILCPK